jgi:hypothetical protein
MAIYTIEKVRDKKTGEVKGRETRRKGHRVKIENVELSVPLIWTYVDEGTFVTTSKVTAYNAEYKTQKHLTVQTKNSVYVFKKEDE